MTGRGSAVASPSGWLPGHRPLAAERRMMREADTIQFNILAEQLREYGPRVMYSAMLFWVRSRGKKDGMAHHCFVAMFGGSVKRAEKGEPIYLDDPRFEEWMRLRQEFSTREWRNARARKRKTK
jgi:hypothetical protein